MTLRHHGARVGLSVLLLLVSAGCGSTTDPSDQGQVTTTLLQPKSGGKIVYGMEADPNGLDPTRNAWDPSGLLVANAIFDTWSAFDANGVAQPYLAKSFEHNADYTVWTVRVREGVKFHDGEVLDADAGVRMIGAIQTSLVTGPAAVTISKAEKVDSLAVKITMNAGWASFPAILTTQGGYVIAPKQLDDPEGSLHPIGTGPFKVVKWDVGKQVTLTKNTAYWRQGLPYLDSVEFKFVGDGRSRITGLQDGTMDVIHASVLEDTAQIDALPKGGKFDVVHDPGATETTFVMFNTAKPPLNDARVRQAVSYATDVNALADSQNWPKNRLTDSPFPADSPWFAKVKFPRNDLGKARDLVKQYEAEHGGGSVTFELSASTEIAAAQQLTEQWARAGIKATLKTSDIKTTVLVAVTGNYDAIMFRFFAAVDPDVVWHFWDSATIKPIGGISLNFSHLADQQIDDALAKGRASDDLPTRKAAYATVQQRFADLVPYIWLYRVDWVIARSTRVHDVRNVTLPDGKPALPFIAGVHRLTETWIDTAT